MVPLSTIRPYYDVQRSKQFRPCLTSICERVRSQVYGLVLILTRARSHRCLNGTRYRLLRQFGFLKLHKGLNIYHSVEIFIKFIVGCVLCTHLYTQKTWQITSWSTAQNVYSEQHCVSPAYSITWRPE
jgi:hypothetical protein